jgi:hypothetical protein
MHWVIGDWPLVVGEQTSGLGGRLTGPAVSPNHQPSDTVRQVHGITNDATLDGALTLGYTVWPDVESSYEFS